MRIDTRNRIQYGGPDTTETLNTKTPNETSVLGPLGIGVGELKKLNIKEQIQYGGPDSTEAQDRQTKNETSLGIGGTKDSFETGKSITDGTSKDFLRNSMLRLDYQEMMKQKDNDNKIAFADGSVSVSNDLQNDLQNTIKKENKNEV